MSDIKSVLFVCTGNSCRSIMAEGLLRRKLEELGKKYIEVLSAGISAADELSPTKETVEVMKKEGVDVSGFKSKRLTDDLIRSSDLILVMEYMHKGEILKRVPEAKAKIYLLKEFGRDDKFNPPEGFSVPDPIGRPLKDYELSLGMIKDEIERIAKIL